MIFHLCLYCIISVIYVYESEWRLSKTKCFPRNLYKLFLSREHAHRSTNIFTLCILPCTHFDPVRIHGSISRMSAHPSKPSFFLSRTQCSWHPKTSSVKSWHVTRATEFGLIHDQEADVVTLGSSQKSQGSILNTFFFNCQPSASQPSRCRSS